MSNAVGHPAMVCTGNRDDEAPSSHRHPPILSQLLSEDTLNDQDSFENIALGLKFHLLA